MPGECYSLRISFGFSNGSPWFKEQIKQTEIFLHAANKFQYYKEDDMPNNFKINSLLLRDQEETVIKLSKTFFTALSKPYSDQPCVKRNDYKWAECLDSLFYADRGCQDPWHVYSNISVPYCSNISQILDDYRNSYTGCYKTCWDKPYMSQRSLSKTVRMDQSCPVPCTTEKYKAEISYKPKSS